MPYRDFMKIKWDNECKDALKTMKESMIVKYLKLDIILLSQAGLEIQKV